MPHMTGEKKIEAITLKLAVSQLNQLRALADADGLSVAEYIRALIEHDFDSKREKWTALNSIFGHGAEIARDDLG